MKKIILLCIAVIGFTSVLWAAVSPASAQKSAAPLPVVAAGAASAVDVMPRWRDALEELRLTVDVLLATNQKLIEESNALQETFTSIENGIAAQQEKNLELRQAIPKKHVEVQKPSETAQLKEEIAFTEKALEDKKQAVFALWEKLKVTEAGLSLRRLKIQQLQIEQQAQQDELMNKGKDGAGDIASQVGYLKSTLDSLKIQEQDARQKIQAIRDASTADVEKMKQAAAERNSLQDALSQLDKEKEAVSRQLVDLAAVESSNGPGNDAKRFVALTQEKKALDVKLSELKMQKDTIQVQVDHPTVNVADIVVENKRLQQECTELEAEISDTRENISVLDYKVSGLEKYKNRKKTDN
ncbi:MAG: hypothetical protein HQL18_04450 [Candidatus Omnitrophica bacterium]|nr:hypothetical protein [Candidatus Omnitrophota bacterium]